MTVLTQNDFFVSIPCILLLPNNYILFWNFSHFLLSQIWYETEFRTYDFVFNVFEGEFFNKILNLVALLQLKKNIFLKNKKK